MKRSLFKIFYTMTKISVEGGKEVVTLQRKTYSITT